MTPPTTRKSASQPQHSDLSPLKPDETIPLVDISNEPQKIPAKPETIIVAKAIGALKPTEAASPLHFFFHEILSNPANDDFFRKIDEEALAYANNVRRREKASRALRPKKPTTPIRRSTRATKPVLRYEPPAFAKVRKTRAKRSAADGTPLRRSARFCRKI